MVAGVSSQWRWQRYRYDQAGQSACQAGAAAEAWSCRACAFGLKGEMRCVTGHCLSSVCELPL